MTSDLSFGLASEAELNNILAGRRAGPSLQWRGMPSLTVREGSFGVLWADVGRELIRPLAIVCREADQRRLFGRFAQLRSDLSPLTSWCHVLTPENFSAFTAEGDLVREASLDRFAAAWTGLIVAEAVLLAQKPVARLRTASCFATQSFAVARTQALWPAGDLVPDVLSEYDAAQKLFRTANPIALRWRAALEPAWTLLIAASRGEAIPSRLDYSPLIEALRGFIESRIRGDAREAMSLARSLRAVATETEHLENLVDFTSERRLALFDALLTALGRTPEGDRPRRTALAMAAGYVATVAAGGKTSLGLVEADASRWPEVLIWAYAMGGLGESVVWTSSFDGLGRLVARELLRSFHLDEAPVTDIAFAEARALVDPQLSDPFVHLRIKQAKVISVGLRSGVSTFIPLPDVIPEEQKSSKNRSPASGATGEISATSGDPLRILADALWPFLQSRIESYGKLPQSASVSSREVGSKKSHAKTKQSSNPRLPLK